jgi:hypothetical protein
MKRLVVAAVLVTAFCLVAPSTVAGASGLPNTLMAKLSGSFTHAGLDINGDTVPGAFHSQGVGRGTLGKLTWTSLSEVDPNFGVNTPRCPGLLDFTYDAFAAVISYKDGRDLLYLRLDPGDVGYGCLDPANFDNDAVFDLTVVGGVGRFEGATGGAHVEIHVNSVLFDATGGYVFGAGAGSLLVELD